MILIDTNVLIAFYNIDDALHERAVELMRKIDAGEFGPACISDYVFDEAMNVCSARTNRKAAIAMGTILQESFHLVRVTESMFRGAWWLFKGASGLSFTDCVNVALVKELEIDHLATFDKEFKKAKVNIVC